jgi:3-phosphoshikimate 1-carboxyvinyltransferase
MQIIIRPSSIQGKVHAPPSKSSMQRACAAALVARGETRIKNPGHSHDDEAALRVIRGLGAEVQIEPDGSLYIRSQGVNPVENIINCGESGLGIRMFTPLAALSEKPVLMDGEGSLLGRPMDFFDDVLPKLEVEIQSNRGRLPLKIKGPLKPKNIDMDGSLSSQFLTGLLMAYAASGASDVFIRVKNLKSRPYIDLTLQVMEKFGWFVENRDYESFYFPLKKGAGDSNPVPAEGQFNYIVEGDWSGGAFLLVAGAISGKIKVKGLDISSAQADKAILKALKDSGAKLSILDQEIAVGPASLEAFDFNATDCPDLFPPLVVLAAYCQGVSVIQGVHRLAHKESNRGLTLQEEFRKMGLEIHIQDDLMKIKGGKILEGAKVHSRLDHRIAMACAVAALGARGETTIEEAQAVNKSYPGFYEDLYRLQGIAGRKD